MTRHIKDPTRIAEHTMRTMPKLPTDKLFIDRGEKIPAARFKPMKTMPPAQFKALKRSK